MSSSDGVTIGSLFGKTAKRFPDMIAQVFDEGPGQTYRELDERSNRLANGLLSLGLRKGDHVAIYASNCQEYLEYILATAKAGMVQVCLNFLMPKERIAYMLEQSDSKAVIFESPFLGAVKHSLEKVAGIKHLVMIERGTAEEPKGIPTYEDLISQSPDTRPNILVQSGDPSVILFTTGTTGVPKAALKTHFADLHVPVSATQYFPCLEATQRLGLPPFSNLSYLFAGPQFHLGGRVFTLMPVIRPAMSVVMKAGRFDPEKYIRLLHQWKVNMTWLHPSMLYVLNQLPKEIIKKYDLSSVQVIMCGAGGLKEQERKDMQTYFPNARLGSTYGGTEAGFVCYITGEELVRGRPDNVRMPLWDSYIKIGDETGNELPPNTVGTIWAKTAALPVNCEYYKDPEGTRKAFKDGWVAVGDQGWMDEKGYFYFFGRNDDVVKSGGEKVSPISVEDVIHLHPKVSIVAVIGVPDERWGEAVAAYVVRKDESLTEEELVAYCKGNLANYEVPRRINFVDELPLNTLGKVDRRSLRERLKANA